MGGEQYEVYVQKGTPWWKVITTVLFSHVGLVILVIGYAVGGAFVFMSLEHDREEAARIAKEMKTKDVNDAIRYIKKTFWHYGTNEHRFNYTRSQFKQAVYTDLVMLKDYVLTANSDVGFDATDDFERDFTFESALLFTITIMTTVGYGHISPKTIDGKMFCIGYSLFGIPLLVIFMTQIGDWMATSFRWLYSRALCRWCRARRRDSELPPGEDRKEKGIAKDEVGKERYMPTDLVMVPIMVNLMLIFIFIFAGAFVFAAFEDWEMSSSAYFCFVTLTTIGFGDMTPVKSFTGFQHDIGAALRMVFTVSYCLLGMPLLSMCMNLMQEQIMEKMSWVAKEIGMGDDGDDEIVKLSVEGKVKETPADKTGNDLTFGAPLSSKKRKKKSAEDEKALV